jgi:hypothetical protein
LRSDFREARFIKPVILPNGALQLELRAQTSLAWRIERSTNLTDWMPVTLETTINGELVIQEPFAALHSPTFYRAVWVQ